MRGGMTVAFLIGALVFWFSGYQYGRNPNLTAKNSTRGPDVIIDAPMWLFYLCGAPTSSTYPKGHLAMAAVRAQIMGLSLGIFAIMAQLGNFSREIDLLGFGLAVLFPYIFSYYLSKRYRTE